MPESGKKDVTLLLEAWSDGNEQALEKLAPLVHRELQRMARHYIAGERANPLQTTELINEAYLRLIGWKSVRWKNRAHFFAVAAQMMRRILVDVARREHRTKRGGSEPDMVLDETAVVRPDRTEDLVALDEALDQLEALDPRKSRVVELRYFGGLSVQETAAVLEVSDRTVLREWRSAKAWLYRELTS